MEAAVVEAEFPGDTRRMVGQAWKPIDRKKRK
jgi:hypothetical protein